MKKLASGSTSLEQEGSLDIDDWLKSRRDVRAIGPLQVKLRARGRADGMTVECDCSVQLEFVCSKCLTTFVRPLEFSFREEFTNKPEAANEEGEIFYVPEDTVDLLPYIEENLQLALPFVAVCRPDCKGLCPVCGSNRNETDCGCKEENTDPRLAALKDFFEKQ